MQLQHRKQQTLLFLSLVGWHAVYSTSDFQYHNVTLSRIAFGSCHKRKYVVNATSTIWDTIVSHTAPEAFLWTGDAVYPPVRGVASLDLLRQEYDQMLHNDSLGYASFAKRYNDRIFGTWDDHDYGGNDLGIEMPDKELRKRAFFDFLGYHGKRAFEERQGVYHSVEFGTAPHKIKIFFLDTRWHRQRHCIPSVATWIPLGAGISCITRWLTAGMKWCTERSELALLGETQWKWLTNEVQDSDAQLNIFVSSIQVLTTNPVVESWGHFPQERQRLLKLINDVLLVQSSRTTNATTITDGTASVVILSGDVHYGEILDPTAALLSDEDIVASRKQSFLEITSSGLTHSCTQPFYGVACEPLLQTFDGHRSVFEQYYIDKNFGSLVVDWKMQRWKIRVHNLQGAAVLSTKWRPMAMEALTEQELGRVAPCMDGHLKPRVHMLLYLLVLVLLWYWTMRRTPPSSKKKRD